MLIFVTDDQRPETLEAMPATTRLFKQEGRWFPNAFTTTPLCGPARASTFTGRFAHNHGVRHNGPGQAEHLDQDSTLQRYLRDAGYRTGLFGKYLNAWDLTRSPPHFDEWAITHHGSYFDAHFNVQGKMELAEGYSTDFISRQSIGFVEAAEEQDDRPWAAFVMPMAAHRPFQAEPAYAHASFPRWSGTPASSERDLGDKPPFVRRLTFDRLSTEQGAPANLGEAIRRKQLRTLQSVDDLVEDVFAALRESGEASRTLAIFMSDNGYMWGEHGLVQKNLPYLPAVKVPMGLRWPGRVSSGTVDRRLAANVDVAPSLVEAAGVTIEGSMDGVSLLGESRRDQLLLEYWRDPGFDVPDWTSVIEPDSQAIEYRLRDRDLREYYELDADPWQLDNLAGDASRAGVADREELFRSLDRIRNCAGRGENGCP